MPEVSVVIPVYNRAKALEEAVRSVSAQSFHDIEIVIVDDGSADETPSILAELAKEDSRIHLLRHDTNRGAGATRNTGISAAQGLWIALLDSDDLWRPEKLERQMEKGGAGIVLCDAWFRSKGRDKLRALPANPDWGQLIVQGHGFNPGSALLARKSVFEAVGPFDESLKRLEDWDWFIRARDSGIAFDHVAQPLVVIRPGVAPEVNVVDEAVSLLKQKHASRFTGKEQSRFGAALYLEKAAVRLWRKDLTGFSLQWLRAFYTAPGRALRFAFARTLRIVKGDAPRFFALMEKKS